MDYITIATTGNASDFGDLLATAELTAGVDSATRGVICGGYTTGAVNVIEYITIAITSNATDFGDMLQVNYGSAGVAGI